MKLSTTLLAASAQATASGPTTTDIKSHGCTGGTPNALFNGPIFQGCISDIECDTKAGYHIFNHFHESGDDAGSGDGYGNESGSLTLVPECRLTSAPAMPGFTCGSDPTLRTNTKIVVPGISKTGYDNDHREIKILKYGRYSSLKSDLAAQSSCPDHGTAATCPNIEHFFDGCGGVVNADGLVIFTNPFNQAKCMPKVTDHKENDSWVEEHKIYVGYDDLVDTLAGGLEVRKDIHKIYEVSCKITKTGDVGTDIKTVLSTENEDVEDSIDTNFYIQKFFGDITDVSTRIELTETDVIPFSPNADRNDRFQFKIWSDHEHEYVHLETCKLTLEGDDDFEQEFINDGCVTDDWKAYFANEYRTQKINEDWFNMRPLLIGCKSKWHIDCTVASCKRGLESTNYGAYEQFCKAGDKCEARYTPGFMDANARKRRSPDGSEEPDVPAEDHVELDLVHPCYYVDEQNPEYCVNADTCWSLEQCTAAFPDDYSDSELDDIMSEFKKALQEHIDDVLSSTESPIDTHDHIMESIRDNASRVMEAKQTFEDAVNAIIESINNL